MRIEISIERLIFDGFAPEDRETIRQAFSAELARLLAERVPPALLADSNSARLNGGEFVAFSSGRPGSAATIGTQAARALYKNL